MNKISQISFGSTYRIPLNQPGVTKAKKDALKELAAIYTNALVPGGRQRFVRVSIPKALDPDFVEDLKKIGFDRYQIFPRHRVSKAKMDEYIREQLNKGPKAYTQKGMQPPKTNKRTPSRHK